jgi:hypothetical protein
VFPVSHDRRICTDSRQATSEGFLYGRKNASLYKAGQEHDELARVSDEREVLEADEDFALQRPQRYMKPRGPDQPVGLLGHAGYIMGALLDKNSNQSAVYPENTVRKNRDPNAPIRRVH